MAKRPVPRWAAYTEITRQGDRIPDHEELFYTEITRQGDKIPDHEELPYNKTYDKEIQSPGSRRANLHRDPRQEFSITKQHSNSNM